MRTVLFAFFASHYRTIHFIVAAFRMGTTYTVFITPIANAASKNLVAAFRMGTACAVIDTHITHSRVVRSLTFAVAGVTGITSITVVTAVTVVTVVAIVTVITAITVVT